LGGLDILINNAGIGGTFTPVHLHTLDDWEKVVAVNLRGVFLFCREALKVMVEQKNGKIINVGSIWGLVGSSLLMPAPAYNATKGAVINLTRELALEYGPLGININCLAPAFFRSGLGDGAYDNPEVVKAMEATLPMGKIGNTDDLNGTIVYMASSASDFMNGHTLVVDMGYTAR
jgi:NAD(P)-dependent dehydrogenase (short-subunit alcohol dehydrogenase family)